MSEQPEGPNPSDRAPSGAPTVRVASRPRGRFAATLLGAMGSVLVALYALSSVTVTADGRIVEPFGALALGMLVLTGAGLFGLARMFGSVRRSSTCGRGGC